MPVSRRRPPALSLLSLLVVAILAAACGGGDGGEDALPADYDLATDGLPAPRSTPDRPIDADTLGAFDLAGAVRDAFDRCGLYGIEELTDLLGGAWQLSVVRIDGAACVWSDSTEPPVTEYLRIAIVRATPSEIGGFDPRLGDDASDLDTVVESALEIGDETYEVPTGTYGSGLAFRKGSVAVQVHAIWGIADTDAQREIERQIEFRVAENLAARLP